VVERHRHVQEREALRHRELEVVDFERRHVHVVDEVVEAAEVVQRRFLHHAALDELGERQHPHEGADGMRVSAAALRAERATRRDQHGRSELERPTQEAAAASALVVDDELSGWQRIRKRHVAEQVALAEELDTVALVVVGIRRSFGSRRHRRASLSARPVGSCPALFGRVAEDEPAAALAAGVHDGPFGHRRELLEHLGAEPLDILDREAPVATARKPDRAEDAALRPVANGVLVHAQRPSGVANVQEFSGCHRRS
jgi:hypothetical protein